VNHRDPNATFAVCPIMWLCFADTHPTLPGHFPGRPLIPGVVLLAKLQTLLASHWPAHVLTQLSQVKFARPVRANETIVLAVTDANEQDHCLQGKFVLRHSGQVVAQGSFTAQATTVMNETNS